jgi:hypothetical protein
MDSDSAGENGRTDDAGAERLDGPNDSPQQSRRKFTRAALTGSAVLFSMGNKGAWGAVQESCISTPVYASWYTGNPSSVARQEAQVEDFLANYDKRLDQMAPDPPEPATGMAPLTCYEWEDGNP